MTDSDKKKLLKSNTWLWVAAMAMAPLFHLLLNAFASGPVKFPWPILMPLLMVGLLLASNKLIEEAAARRKGDPAPEDGA